VCLAIIFAIAQEQKRKLTYLIRDNDGSALVHTPVRAPRANADSERWVRSVHEECLDQLIILNPAQRIGFLLLQGSRAS